jgi:hypothetical protein
LIVCLLPEAIDFEKVAFFFVDDEAAAHEIFLERQARNPEAFVAEPLLKVRSKERG